KRAVWRRVRNARPDVVYNRVSRRSLERRRDVRRALAILRSAGIPIFNPGFLDKESVYRWLSADPRTAPNLPPYKRLTSTDDLRQAIHKWGAVFMKPVGGSLG